MKSTPSGGATRHDSPVARGRRARCARPSVAGLEHDAWNQPRETTVARRPVARAPASRVPSPLSSEPCRSDETVTRPPHRSKMQTTVLALALGSAAAFVGPAAQAPATAVNAGQGDLVALAEANGDQLGRNLGFWDPLGASSLDFFGLEQSGRLPSGATVGYLRHAEIKHGRVAMAAFVGYCLQANGVRVPWTPYPGFQDGLTPPEQWANVPAAGKWQFFVFIGILEALGECFPSGEHYMAGGRPGVYPRSRSRTSRCLSCGLYPPHGFNVDLLPFRASLAKQDESKARGRQVEINNGRAAMLGIFSLLSEQKVPGAVPFLSGKIPTLPDMEIMGPSSARTKNVPAPSLECG